MAQQRHRRSILLLGLLHSYTRSGALVATLGGHVRLDRRLIEELQSRVYVRDARQLLGRVVQIQLEDREEALEVGLLVDRELHHPGRERLLSVRVQVIAAALGLRAEAELLQRQARGPGAAAVHGEEALVARVGLDVRLDYGQLLRLRGA